MYDRYFDRYVIVIDRYWTTIAFFFCINMEYNLELSKKKRSQLNFGRWLAAFVKTLALDTGSISIVAI